MSSVLVYIFHVCTYNYTHVHVCVRVEIGSDLVACLVHVSRALHSRRTRLMPVFVSAGVCCLCVSGVESLGEREREIERDSDRARGRSSQETMTRKH